jgi:hypothetical protein
LQSALIEKGPRNNLLQFLVLGFGFFQNGDVGVGVGVFPEGEQVFVGSEVQM